MVVAKIFAIGILALRACALPLTGHIQGSNSNSNISHTSSIPTSSTSSTSFESAEAEVQLQRLAEIARHVAVSHVTHAPRRHEACTQQAMRVRRDWRVFTPKEKKAYIKSVLCLQHLPSQTPHNLAPGVRSRYDDFVATHINQTVEIHYTVCLGARSKTLFEMSRG